MSNDIESILIFTVFLKFIEVQMSFAEREGRKG